MARACGCEKFPSGVNKLPNHCRERPLWRSPWRPSTDFKWFRHPTGTGQRPFPTRTEFFHSFKDCKIKSLPRNEFIQVQQCAGRRSPGGPLSDIDSGGDIRSGHLQGLCRTAPKAFHLLRQKRVDPGNLFRLRRPCQAKPECQRQALGVTGRGLAQDSLCQRLSKFIIALIVQERQRLQRRVGAVAARTGSG